MHISSFDWKQGGLKTPIKFLDRDSIEYSICQAAMHDRNEERMARLSLDSAMALLDQEQGGIYQFATENGWKASRYSKTIAAQAGSLRLYALAYAQFHDHRYLQSARHICDFLGNKLLTSSGAFRSAVNDNVVSLSNYHYKNCDSTPILKTRENAWACEALASCYEFTGEQAALKMARDCMRWLLEQRYCAAGGFGDHEATAPALADNLAVARAALQMYRITMKPDYLQHASTVSRFIRTNFYNPDGGFNASARLDTKESNCRQIDENICLARFLNLLHYYLDEESFLHMARHGLAYLSTPEVATSRIEEAGILLLDEELNTTPLKIQIIANDAPGRAAKLAESALRYSGWYKVIHCQESIPGG